MGRHKSFVCESCSLDFTRESTANRHNRNIHSGRGNIVRTLEYIVRRQISSNGVSKNNLKGHKLLVCVTCSQDFTRKSSADRHNYNIHSGMGIIVRFVEYVVGRLEGRYAPSDPSLFRKNNGNNIRMGIHKQDGSSNLHPHKSLGDSIAVRESNPELSNLQSAKQANGNNYDFSDMDYIISLVSRVQEIKNLLSIPQSSRGMLPANSLAIGDIPIGVDVNTLIAQQFDYGFFFGYREEVCAGCIYDAIFRLDFRGGSIHERTWSSAHECDPKVFAMYDNDSRGRKYVEACDSMPSKLLPIVNRWLKDNPTIFAIKLPYISDRQRGLIEIANPNNLDASICIPFSNEDLPIKFTADQDWAARAVANEGKSTLLNGQEELQEFLENVRGSTFGIFDVHWREGLGYRSDHFLIYLGKSVATVKVHTDG